MAKTITAQLRKNILKALFRARCFNSVGRIAKRFGVSTLTVRKIHWAYDDEAEAKARTK